MIIIGVGHTSISYTFAFDLCTGRIAEWADLAANLVPSVDVDV